MNGCEFSSSFVCFFHNSIFSHGFFLKLIAHSLEPAAFHQLIKGARACHNCPLFRLTYRRQQLRVFLLFSSFPMFFHHSLFQLNCSIHDAACLPSVDNVNKSLSLPSHACESCEEGSDGKFPLLFSSATAIPNFFS